jgi:hypothetical protein
VLLKAVIRMAVEFIVMIVQLPIEIWPSVKGRFIYE